MIISAMAITAAQTQDPGITFLAVIGAIFVLILVLLAVMALFKTPPK